MVLYIVVAVKQHDPKPAAVAKGAGAAIAMIPGRRLQQYRFASDQRDSLRIHSCAIESPTK